MTPCYASEEGVAWWCANYTTAEPLGVCPILADIHRRIGDGAQRAPILTRSLDLDLWRRRQFTLIEYTLRGPFLSECARLNAEESVSAIRGAPMTLDAGSFIGYRDTLMMALSGLSGCVGMVDRNGRWIGPGGALSRMLGLAASPVTPDLNGITTRSRTMVGLAALEMPEPASEWLTEAFAILSAR